MTLSDLCIPQRASVRVQGLARAAMIVAGSALIALTAQIELRLPFSPVPITGQTFGVLLVAALLGGTRGALAVIAYLAEGVGGLPVFAGGAAGVLHLLGPTGGYLIGFIPAAWIVGLLAERGWDRRPATTAVAMALGSAVILALGLMRLVFFVGPEHVLVAGLYPFVLGDIIKIAAAAFVLPSLRKLAQPSRRGAPRISEKSDNNQLS